MRIFPPSTVPHPWRLVMAVLLADVVFAVTLYLGIDLLGWLAVHVGSWDWSFNGPVSA